MDKIVCSEVLKKLEQEAGKYIIVSVHREENIDNEANFMSLMGAINNIAERYQMPAIYSTHPRSLEFIEQRHSSFTHW